MDADKVFSGMTVTVVDDRFDYGAVRNITAGFLDGRMVVIVWTERSASRHIISMRYCHDKKKGAGAKYFGKTLTRDPDDAPELLEASSARANSDRERK